VLMTSRIRIGLFAAVATALTLATSACGPAAITGSTLCRDYLTHTGQERSDAAIRLSSELHAQDPGSPMWAPNLDYNCGHSPKDTVRQAFGLR
jgi:hypothetical protein